MRAITFGQSNIDALLPKPRFHLASEFATPNAQNNLINKVIKVAGVKNDAGLSRLLEVAPPVISKIRHNRLAVGATLAIAISEETGMSIADMTAILSGQVQA